MTTSHRTLAIITWFFLLHACVAIGQENDGANRPRSFGKLLNVGQTVMLRTSNEHPLYTLRLLTDKQVGEVEKLVAERDEMKQRITSMEEQLEAEQTLEQSAKLLKKQLELESQVNRTVYRIRVIGSPYQVTHVGEDYVALKSGETERFVPWRSIRYMHRSESLPDAPPGRRFGPSRRVDVTQRMSTTISLRHIDEEQAEQLTKVIKQLYSDLILEVTFNSNRKTITLKHQRGADVEEIERLIKALDTNSTKTAVSTE